MSSTWASLQCLHCHKDSCQMLHTITRHSMSSVFWLFISICHWLIQTKFPSCCASGGDLVSTSFGSLLVPAVGKKIGRFVNDCYQLPDMICYCNMGSIIKELLTRGIGGSRWRCKCESQRVGQTRGWCAALCHPHLLQRYWSAGHRAGLRNCQETRSRTHHEHFLLKRAAPHATITPISS